MDRLLDGQYYFCAAGSGENADVEDEENWVQLQTVVTHVDSASQGRQIFRQEFLLAGEETPPQTFSSGALLEENLERFADSFDFSILTPVQEPVIVDVEPEPGEIPPEEDLFLLSHGEQLTILLKQDLTGDLDAFCDFIGEKSILI